MTFLTVLILLTFATCAHAQLRTYTISQKNYIHALDFAKQFNLDFKWNSTLRTLSLTSDKYKIILKDNDTDFIINKKIYTLKDKIILQKGAIFLPYEFMGKIGKIDRVKKILVSPQKDQIKKIVIDPGHGGKDPGAVGGGGVREKDIVLSIGLELRRQLKAHGYQVIMTRDTDVFIPLWLRAQIANKANADLFLSIHANAARAYRAHGAEIFYLSDAMDDYSKSIEAAENAVLKYENANLSAYSYNITNTRAAIWDLKCDQNRKDSIKLAKNILANMTHLTPFKNRGLKCARFYVLKKTLIPSILIETGFVTNKFDARNLSQKRVQKNIATSILQGIKSH